MKTLYSDALGGYDFAKFDNTTTTSPTVGYIFLVIFLLAMLIILLNFLIAILSNTYTILIEKSNALFLRGVIMYHNLVGDSKHWSCICSTFPPYNLMLIVFYPFVFILKSHRLNTFVLALEYIPVAILGLIIFAIISALLLPIANVVLVLYHFKNLFHREGWQSWFYRFLKFALFLFFGWAILCFYYIVDILIICKSFFDTNLKTRRENEN